MSSANIKQISKETEEALRFFKSIEGFELGDYTLALYTWCGLETACELKKEGHNKILEAGRSPPKQRLIRLI